MLKDFSNQSQQFDKQDENKQFDKKQIVEGLYSSRIESYLVAVRKIIHYCRVGYAEQFSDCNTLGRLLFPIEQLDRIKTNIRIAEKNNQKDKDEESEEEGEDDFQTIPSNFPIFESSSHFLHKNKIFQTNAEQSYPLNTPLSGELSDFHKDTLFPTTNPPFLMQNHSLEQPDEDLATQAIQPLDYEEHHQQNNSKPLTTNSIFIVNFHNKTDIFKALYLLTRKTNPKATFVQSKVMAVIERLFENKYEEFNGKIFKLQCQIICNRLSNTTTDPEETHNFYSSYITNLIDLYHKNMNYLKEYGNDDLYQAETAIYEIEGCLRIFVLFLSKSEIIPDLETEQLLEPFYESLQSEIQDLVQKTIKYVYYIAIWSHISILRLMFHDDLLSFLYPICFNPYTSQNRSPFYSIEIFLLLAKRDLPQFIARFVDEFKIFETDLQRVDFHLRTSFFQLLYHTSQFSEETTETFLSNIIGTIIEQSPDNILNAADLCRIHKAKFLKSIISIFFNFPKFREFIIDAFGKDNIFILFTMSLSIFTSDKSLSDAGHALRLLIQMATSNPSNGLMQKITDRLPDIIMELETALDENISNVEIFEILHSVLDNVQSIS